MKREGPAASLSITSSCRSIKSLVSEAFIDEVSEELNSDSSIADNTFLKGGVMLRV